MIGDLCNPLNPGELDTVRIIMNVQEAEHLLKILNQYRKQLRPHVFNGPSEDAYDDLRRILENALERARD